MSLSLLFAAEAAIQSKIVSDRGASPRSWNVNLALKSLIEQDSRFSHRVSVEAKAIQSEAILLLCVSPHYRRKHPRGQVCHTFLSAP